MWYLLNLEETGSYVILLLLLLHSIKCQSILHLLQDIKKYLINIFRGLWTLLKNVNKLSLSNCKEVQVQLY